MATYENTVRDHRTGRKCARCDGVLHDSIVNFGESLPAEALDRAFDNAKKADLCLVLGSSLTVSPANEIPEVVGRRKGAKLAICNLQSTPLDKLTDVRVYTKTDDLMIRIMEKLDFPIPAFILRRRLVVDFSTKDERHQLKVYGIDEDGTPVSFLQSINLAYNRRLLKSEPFTFNLRSNLDPGLELKLELEFMGHYGEPNLEIVYKFDGDGQAQIVYLLEYDPMTGEWKTSKQSGLAREDEGPEIIDLTDDTTILSNTLSEVSM